MKNSNNTSNEIQIVISIIEHATKSNEPAISRVKRKHDMNPKQVQKIIDHLIEINKIKMITCELGDGWNSRREYQGIKFVSVNSNNTTNEIMKTAFEKYPKAQKIVFKSDLENMNSVELLHCAAAYSCLPFQAGENVVKMCASMYESVSHYGGNQTNFYNMLNNLVK